jgi:hypothetical protein
LALDLVVQLPKAIDEKPKLDGHAEAVVYPERSGRLTGVNAMQTRRRVAHG